MNAIIYCRVSTTEQTKNLSLTTQLASCRDYCRREGYRVVGEFIEEGKSAKTADRTELQRLLDYARQNKGKVSVLVVFNVSRFSRNQLDHFALRAHLARLGIMLRSATEPIDDSATGRLMEGLFSTLAEFDNNQKAERTKAGMLTALEAGRWVWVAPLGYRNGPRGGPSLVLDSREAAIIRAAFDAVASGQMPVVDVLRLVSDLGLKTRSGGRMSLQSLHKLLRNPLYMGTVVAPKWDVTRAGDFEPVVSEAVFSRVQTVLSGRGARNVRHLDANPDFPLRRFVRCGKCDGPLTASWSKGRSNRYAYYHCVKCGGVRVGSPRLEGQFLELLEGLRPTPAYVRLFDVVVRDVWAQRQESSVRTGAVAEGRVKELRDRLARLDEAFIFKQEIDRQSYASMRDRYREELALAEIAVQEARIEELDIEGALAASQLVLSNAAALWQQATVEQRQQLQRALFPDGLTHDGEKFGTATTGIAFSTLQALDVGKEGVASPTGFEPVFWP